MSILIITHHSDNLLRVKLTYTDAFKYQFNRKGVCSAIYSFIFGHIDTIDKVQSYINRYQQSSINTKLIKQLRERGIKVIARQPMQPLINSKSSICTPSIEMDKYQQNLKKQIEIEIEIEKLEHLKRLKRQTQEAQEEQEKLQKIKQEVQALKMKIQNRHDRQQKEIKEKIPQVQVTLMIDRKKQDFINESNVENQQKKTEKTIPCTPYFLSFKESNNDTRKTVSPYSTSSIRQYKQLCNDEATKNMAQSEWGNSKVYFPKSHPEIIIKKTVNKNIDSSGENAARNRFNIMEQVRHVIDRLKCSHLVVPKAIVYNDYLIEDRLPINPSIYHNMRNYILEPRLFNEAVREMVRLSSLFYFNDFVCSNFDIAWSIPNIKNAVRYDNCPLYFVTEHGKKQGRIGLIDIEDATTITNAKGLTNLVRIFPYHYDIIKQEADRLFNSFDDHFQQHAMEYNISDLDDAAETGKRYLSVGYCEISKRLKNKNVSTDSSTWSMDIRKERLDDLKKIIVAECLLLNKGDNGLKRTTTYLFDPFKYFLKDNVDKSAEMLSNIITPMFISNLQEQLTNYINTFSNRMDLRNLEEDEMINLRTVNIKINNLYSDIANTISNLVQTDRCCCINKTHIDNHYSFSLVIEQLSYVTMLELVKGGELLSYDYFKHYDYCRICY